MSTLNQNLFVLEFMGGAYVVVESHDCGGWGLENERDGDLYLASLPK